MPAELADDCDVEGGRLSETVVRDVATWMVSPMVGYDGEGDRGGDKSCAEPSIWGLLAVEGGARETGVILGAVSR